jgi:hypothetical protein
LIIRPELQCVCAEIARIFLCMHVEMRTSLALR